MWQIILLMIAGLFGFWSGSPPPPKVHAALEKIHPETDFPVIEHKSFVIVLYAYNQSLWCERSLSSVFEQDYDHYRVIFIDDGSLDLCSEKVKEFIVENKQEGKVILLRNETRLGLVASLYRAIDTCLDREIIIPLEAKDWFTHPNVLNRLNAAYQNPDVWLTSTAGLTYPSYQLQMDLQHTFYAALFKQIRLQDLYDHGRFSTSIEAYLAPIEDLAGGRVRQMGDPLVFSNLACPIKPEEPLAEIGKYKPLAQFPLPEARKEKADILLFSYDCPLQLYACLESIQRYITGFENLFVLYKASAPQFATGYEQVQNDFPVVHFIPAQEFKTDMLKVLFDSPSNYILFGADCDIVKDFVDLNLCMQQMQKTGAYGFYLQFGRHIQSQLGILSLPLTSTLYAWDIQTGKGDWALAHNLDMTLFRKEEIQKSFQKMKIKTFDQFKSTWAQQLCPPKAMGLYFESSKIVHVPLEEESFTKDEWLAKFNQGLKIDIEPLYKVENSSVYLDYVPEFILR